MQQENMVLSDCSIPFVEKWTNRLQAENIGSTYILSDLVAEW